jgi:hypothetical protein
MKMNWGLRIFLLGCMVVVFAGCATHRIDWTARIGHYTYDQAVTELGPPDKQAKLTDGRVVAEWITRYNNGTTVFVGSGFYPGRVGYVQTVGPSYYEDRLRLTFATNHVLSDWSKK